MNIGQYAKSIVTVIAAGVGILTAALSDGVVTPVEYVNIAIAIVVAFGVYLVPTLPAGPARIGKTIVAAAGASLSALVIIVAGATGFGAVTTGDWLAVALAGLAAVGVYIVPNITKAPVTETPAATVVYATTNLTDAPPLI